MKIEFNKSNVTSLSTNDKSEPIDVNEFVTMIDTQDKEQIVESRRSLENSCPDQYLPVSNTKLLTSGIPTLDLLGRAKR